MRAISSLLALPLLVLGVDADHADHALPFDQLAVGTHPLDRRTNLHFSLSLYLVDPAPAVVAFRQLDPNPVSRAEPRETGREAIGDVSEDLGPVFELDPKNSVREGLQNHPAHELGRLGHER
jgi:hypothetical protein